MKTYRFYYIFCSCTTECYIKANTEEEAKQKFIEKKGERVIISIELCAE